MDDTQYFLWFASIYGLKNAVRIFNNMYDWQDSLCVPVAPTSYPFQSQSEENNVEAMQPDEWPQDYKPFPGVRSEISSDMRDLNSPFYEMLNLANMNQDASTVEDSKTAEEGKRATYFCIVCHKGYVSPDGVRKHGRKAHPDLFANAKGEYCYSNADITIT